MQKTVKYYYILFIILLISAFFCNFSMAKNIYAGKDKTMNLNELRLSHKLVDLFVKLAEIPSPSRKEGDLSEKILEIFKSNNIDAKYDDYRNIIAKIPASKGYENAPSLLLSAHMDVVGGSEPVNIRLSQDGRYIETDKTRTLGADNKAGVAAILDLAIDMSKTDSEITHGPIEITFTRDEEMGMTGIQNLDTSKIHSKYAIIADGEYLGEHDSEGAGFINLYIKVYQGKGGHSGINIDDPTRINAIKVLSELDTRIPQGVYKKDPKRGVITSINAGVNTGGSANTSIAEIVKDVYQLAKDDKPIPEKYNSKDILNTINRESALNIINTEAYQTYSIRSSEPENEQELIKYIEKQVDELNSKYSGLIKIEMEAKVHLKPFIKSEDKFLSNVIVKAGQKYNLNCQPGSFHAGAETHILANEKKNAKGEIFIPVIIGLANLENIHSANEKIDWSSFLTGRKWLENIVVNFATEKASQ
ncbi:MAG: hypothetical protein A2255_09300 [Candidatus Melainabacteria bacterium RIFOXYA2_FULL_32_9]|nr:MAG: hypothetical protein A2255_09300 [Candidatus Melainabacteria bacterium RIFOXYA2_FULL_32_9]